MWEFLPWQVLGKERCERLHLSQSSATSKHKPPASASARLHCGNSGVGAVDRAAEKERTTCFAKSPVPWGCSAIVSIFNWHAFITASLCPGLWRGSKRASEQSAGNSDLRPEPFQGSFAGSLFPFMFQPRGCCSFTIPSTLKRCSRCLLQGQSVEGSSPVQGRDTAEQFCFGGVLSCLRCRAGAVSQGWEAEGWHVLCPGCNLPRYFD